MTIRTIRGVWVGLALLLAGCVGPVAAGEPPATPFLRIETGMHTAIIKRIAVDAAGRYLVTGSDDKTARVWDLATGKLLQTLRPPQGAGDEGKVYAVALSPDGATVAVAGWIKAGESGHSIYLFDRADGRLVRRLGGLPNAINHLAFSADGRYLAAALGRNNGIRVYRSADGQEIARDTEYGDNSYSVDFDRSGRLLSTSYDGHLRLYGADFRLIAKKKAPGGKRPFFARFAPDGRTIAVGFDDSTAVNLLSGENLSFLHSPDTPAVDNGDLSKVAWSRDGRRLYAGGRYYPADQLRLLRWDQGGHGRPQRFRVSTHTIMDLRPLVDGRLAFGAAGPAFGVLDAQGRKLWEKRGEILDHRDNEGRLRLSRDGGVAEFGFDTLDSDGQWRRRSARFDLAERRLLLDPDSLADLAAPDTGGEPVQNWKGTTAPQVRGQKLTLEPYEISRSLALAPAGDGFMLGTEWLLRYYDTPDRERWQVPVPGIAWAVNLAGDGRHAVAAFGDGTIRWHETTEGREVLALFVHPDGQRWVAWTPEGFYDAAPGAESLIGYHLNRGADREGEFVAADRLRQNYYRPDLIARRLEPDGGRLVAEAARAVGDVRQVLAGERPPRLELLSPDVAEGGREYLLKLRIKDQGGGVGRLIYRIDGVEVPGRPADIPGSGGDTVSRLFDFAGRNPDNRKDTGERVLSVAAVSPRGVESEPVTVRVRVPAATERPVLHVLAVGVTKYRDNTFRAGVAYAANDAATLRGHFEKYGSGFYRGLDLKVLRDEEATREGIEREMRGFAERTAAGDVFVLYLAGHGTAFDGDYSFIPWETRYVNAGTVREQSLRGERLKELLAGIPAQKALVLLDTCGSGSFGQERGRGLGEKEALDRLGRLSGRTIIAATAEGQMALEGVNDHGAFTAVLLEALQGRADRPDRGDVGYIELNEVGDYVEEELPRLTEKKWGLYQTPYKEIRGNSFPLLPKPRAANQ
jgi:hypothetical protein